MDLETILANEPVIRLISFFGVLVVMALWEVAAPRRARSATRLVRWTNNFAIVILSTLVLRAIFPIAAVALAVLAQERGWGLINHLMNHPINQGSVPNIFILILSILVLDLAIYLQHVMFHAVPALWRLHRMHHTDLDFDVTTGARFHPVEIALSMGIKLAVVAALGPPVIAVLAFEILLNATAMFNHSNVRIAPVIDSVLRLFIVTPDMHRVHHSILPRETNSNFGFNLPWWDRLLGTYIAQPSAGHLDMTLGIDQFRSPRDLWLDRMLVQPFIGAVGAYPIKSETEDR